MPKNSRIAILGATGHIAKGLIYNFSQASYQNIDLFARSLTRLEIILEQMGGVRKYRQKKYVEFNKNDYDVVINCVGLGTPEKVKQASGDVFYLTEHFDNLALEYLSGHTKTLYINFSSGAVYGTDFATPVDGSSLAHWNINNLQESEYYGIAKLNSEAKHRALKNLNIVDLRIFNYFSRFTDLHDKYLLSEIILCVKNGEALATDKRDIVRDYVYPPDLFSLVEKCIAKRALNDSFDVYSKKPATKFEILEYFKKSYGLKYLVNKTKMPISATGNKDNYYSTSRKAGKIGYTPKFTSLDTIIQIAKELLADCKHVR